MQYKTKSRFISRSTRNPKPPVKPTIPNGHYQVYNDLMAYTGNFTLLHNLRNAINRYGNLTDKQWAAAKKCLAPQDTPDPNVILAEGCHVPITVSASAARYIARIHNWPVNPRTLTVVQINSYSRRKYKVKVKIDWDSNVSECRCCGRSLTDWRSQATGVGPTCVKRTNIQYVRHQSDVARFQQEIQKLVAQLGVVEVELKDWHIQLGSDALERIVKMAKPTPVKPTIPNGHYQAYNSDIPLIHFKECEWNPKDRTLHFDRKKADELEITDDHERLYVHNTSTGNTVLFAKLGRFEGISRYSSMDNFPKNGNNVDIQLIIK